MTSASVRDGMHSQSIARTRRIGIVLGHTSNLASNLGRKSTPGIEIARCTCNAPQGTEAKDTTPSGDRTRVSYSPKSPHRPRDPCDTYRWKLPCPKGALPAQSGLWMIAVRLILPAGRLILACLPKFITESPHGCLSATHAASEATQHVSTRLQLTVVNPLYIEWISLKTSKGNIHAATGEPPPPRQSHWPNMASGAPLATTCCAGMANGAKGDKLALGTHDDNGLTYRRQPIKSTLPERKGGRGTQTAQQGHSKQ